MEFPVTYARKKGQHIQVLISTPVSLFFIGRTFLQKLPKANEHWVLLIFLFFFGLLMWGLLVNALRMVFRKDPALVVDENGVQDLISWAEVGSIPWENIQGCEPKKMSSSAMVVLLLKDPAPVLNKLEGMKRRMAEANMKKAGSPVALPLKFIDASEEMVMGSIRAGLERYQAMLATDRVRSDTTV